MRLLLNKTSFKCRIQMYCTKETALIAKMACVRLHIHTKAHTPSAPKWAGPFPDSHFDGIISLITHDAKGCTNIQKTSQSVNHKTDTETLITTTQPEPRISGGEWLPYLLYTKHTQKTQFYISQQRSMLASSCHHFCRNTGRLRMKETCKGLTRLTV